MPGSLMTRLLYHRKRDVTGPRSQSLPAEIAVQAFLRPYEEISTTEHATLPGQEEELVAACEVGANLFNNFKVAWEL